MRSLLTLSLAFALLVTYMETMVPESQAAMIPVSSAKVIRIQDESSNIVVATEQPAALQCYPQVCVPSQHSSAAVQVYLLDCLAKHDVEAGNTTPICTA